VNRYTLAFPSYGYSSTVTDPLGTVRTYSFSRLGASLAFRLTTLAEPAGAGSAAASRTFTYDTNCNVTSRNVTDVAKALSRTRTNTITYALDNAGNRIGEEVRDPANALTKSLSRAMDALNRMRQLTGVSGS
jgi:uncharacterized protein RhaS with RHS repeats